MAEAAYGGVDNAAAPRLRPIPLGQVRLLDGPLKERQDTHRRFLLLVDPDRLLAPFRAQAGLPAKAERYGGWEARDIAGHSMGHYLSALALLYAATVDTALRERVDYVVSELDACQQADGDGYVLPVDKRAFEELRAGRLDVSPFSLNDVWVPYYTLHKVLAGLRDAYRYANSALALAVERRFVDWLDAILSALTPAQIQEMLRSEHGGMNEVLADLAVDTGDRRYLDMAARDFHHQAVLAPLLRGADELDGLHGNTQIPKVVGLAREYELTGEASYRTAAATFWDSVVNRRSYVVGGHSESEHFFAPERFPAMLTPHTCESCNTYNLIRLTGHLFAWEPDVARMDFVERALLNHLAANIGREPGEFGYFLGLQSVGVKVFSEPLDAWWCCVGTGMENPARYGEQIYFSGPDELWVNLYVGSAVAWPEQGVTLQQTTRFPEEDTVRLTVSCAQPTRFALRLRHPGWCDRPELRINGEIVAVTAHPSSYIAVEWTWQSGDTVQLRLPMRLRSEALPHSNGAIVALLYGPLVLAGLVPLAEGEPNPGRLRFSDHLTARGKTGQFPPVLVAPDIAAVLAALEPTGTGFAEFGSRGVVRPDDLRFIPFYRVYEEPYAVYFPLMTAAEWSEREAELRAAQQRQARIEAATLDVVTPGFQQPEVEHALESENSTIREFRGRTCREARDGGWFSYAVAVDPIAEMALIATYWSGEWRVRTFDILVDDVLLVTERGRTDRPGAFFDVVYRVPPELTAGKRSVRVRWVSRPGDTAGIFGLRMVRADTADEATTAA